MIDMRITALPKEASPTCTKLSLREWMLPSEQRRWCNAFILPSSTENADATALIIPQPSGAFGGWGRRKCHALQFYKIHASQ